MIRVIKASQQEDFLAIYKIRNEVFIEEQNCPKELEYENEEVSNYFLAFVNDYPVGTCRWRETNKGIKCERFAVLKPFRSLSIGSHLLDMLLDDLPKDATYIYLHAQISAMGLYKKYGFIEEGEKFEEAGIMHYKMVRRIKKKPLLYGNDFST